MFALYRSVSRRESSGFPLVSVLSVSVFLSVVSPLTAAEDTWELSVLRENGRRVADWMLAHPKKHHPLDWTYGAFYAGLTTFGLSDPSLPYLDTVRELGKTKQWGLLRRTFHADDHCIAQSWLEIALHEDNPAAAANVRRTFDYILSSRSGTPLAAADKGGKLRMNFERWCWCDALFMAPASWGRMAAFTGDDKYRTFLDQEYRACYDELYDKEAHLFYRDSRYKGRKTKNGSKVFWSRGDGWVLGGLPMILRDMPKDWPARPFYETLFKEMAAALKACQREDGAWSPSLLDSSDPDMQEMSGTSFFCFGIMWGINNGLLDEAEYLPVVRQAWKAMNRNVTENGKFGWVQQIGDRPVSDYGPDSTEVYAVGAYLLANVEIKKYVVAKAHPERKTVTVAAPKQFRAAHTVELDFAKLGLKKDSLRVFSVRDGAVLPHQLDDGKLLFSACLPAKAESSYWVFNGDDVPQADLSELCYGRYAPDRLDDYLWENDKVAFRIYGFAVSQRPPKGEGLVSSGVDVWNKAVSYPIINKWLAAAKHYHSDHGEGMDNYKVGPTCGCGGFAVYRNGKVYTSRNWETQRTICNGPVRTRFEITYAPWSCGEGVTIAERRVITLDRGQPFSRHESVFELKGAERLAGGPGLYIAAKNLHAGALALRPDLGWVANAEDEQAGKGSILTAVYLPGGARLAETGKGDLLLLGEVTSGKAFVWYAGAAWTGAGRVTKPCAWTWTVERFAASCAEPLSARVE